jgi:DNA-binding winged helix-turn-helix (wHTH) protein/Tfp pilus assembly protein PilF
VYRFAHFTLDDHRSVLFAGDQPVPLARKVVDTLIVLVRHSDSICSKEELLLSLWPDGFIEEGNLTQNIYLLRRLFKEHGIEGAIQTIPRRGYRFTLPISQRVGCVRRSKVSVRLASGFAAAALCLGILPIRGDINGWEHPFSQSRALGTQDAQLYALGQYNWNLRTLPALRLSIQYFSRVSEDTPQSALGYSGLADGYIGLYDYACESHGCPQYRELATRYAQKAVEVDPSSAEAHTSLAMVLHVFDGDNAASNVEFQRAIEVDPAYAVAHEWFGNSLLLQGQLSQARRQLEIAASLDPVSPATYAWLARAAFFMRDYPHAVIYAQRALSIDPKRLETRILLGLATQGMGDYHTALVIFRTLERDNPVLGRSLLAGIYARTGRRAEAEQLLASANPRDPDFAFALLALHENKAALKAMQQITFHNRIERVFFRLDPRLGEVPSQSHTRWLFG